MTSGPTHPRATNRRSFLRGALSAGVAGVATGAAAGAGIATALDGARPAAAALDNRVPFHGAHQAGIATPPQRNAAVVSFDVLAADRGELTELMRALTDRS